MQWFDRAGEPPPAVLTGKEASYNRRMLSDFMRFGHEKLSQSNVPRSSLSLDDSSMHGALDRLFHGRCAFCEARDKISPYRFRPAAEALPAAKVDQPHLYYAWLENAWEKHLRDLRIVPAVGLEFLSGDGRACAAAEPRGAGPLRR